MRSASEDVTQASSAGAWFGGQRVSNQVGAFAGAPNHCSGIFPSTVRLRKANRVGAERNTATATAPVKVSVGSISKRTRASRGLTTLRCSVEQDRLPHFPTDRQFGEARLKRLALGRL